MQLCVIDVPQQHLTIRKAAVGTQPTKAADDVIFDEQASTYVAQRQVKLNVFEVAKVVAGLQAHGSRKGFVIALYLLGKDDAPPV